ncbi:MAG: cyclic nucleotide-binding domain-containing protein [Verrucomicrobiia bacterium]
MSDSLDQPVLPPIGFVADLKDEDRELLSSYGEFLPANPEHDLIEQGWPQEHLFLLISGQLEVRRTGLEKDVLIGVINPGESVGETSVFDPGPASATVRPREFSQVWRIDRDSLNSYLADNPVAGVILLIGIATALSQRVRLLTASLTDALS